MDSGSRDQRWRNIDGFVGDGASDQVRQELAEPRWQYWLVRSQKIFERPPFGAAKGLRFEKLEVFRLPFAAVAPCNMDLLVAFKVVTAEIELDVLFPHDRPNLGIFNTCLFVQLTGNSNSAVLTRVNATAWNLEPRGFGRVCWITAIDQEDAPLPVE